MRTRILTSLAVISLLAFAGGADATHAVPDCDLDDRACQKEWIDHTTYELDPRNWPCTCDPQPDPW